MLLLDEGALATALGYASIGCWLCAQLPQVIKNWQLGSCDGLSFPFLVTWLFGDLTNLIGCILTHQLPFQTYLATYFCFVDITLVCQYFYYAKKPALLLKPASPRASTTALRHVASHPRGTSPHPTPVGSLGRPPSGRGRIRPQIGIPQHVHPHTITESPVYVGPSDSVEALYAAALDVARAAERVSLRRSNSGRPRGRQAATMPPEEAGLLHSFYSDTSLHSASTDEDERAYHRMTQSTGSLLHRGRSLTRIRTPASGTATPMNEGADRLDELPESGMVEIRRGRRSASRSQSAARAARGTGRRAATVAFMSLGLLVWRASPAVQMYNAPTGSGHVVARFEPAPPEASNAFPLHIHPVPLPFPESTASQLLWFDAPASEPGKDDGRKERPKPQPISLQEAIGRISAWCCTTLYLSSRLPQIWKNFQRKSVEGLSILLFFFAFLGNTLYVASILLMPVKPEEYTRHVLQSLPYLLGSGGTLLFDLTIMFQAWLYGSSPPLPPPRTPLDRPRRTLSYGAMPRRRRHVEEGQPHERSRLLGGGSPMRSATEPMRSSASRLNSIDMESPVMPASGLGSGGLSSTQSVATSALQSANQSAGNICKIKMSAVQCFGKKKTATAVAHVTPGRGLVRLNGSPISLVEPALLRYKVYEPILVAGTDKFANIDIRLRVKGGGHVSQLYALRQAIAKGLVAFYAKNEDAASALELKKTLIAYDRTLLVADPRRCEPKKFGGRGARARRQKSYR
ncbi:uncharacterized protein CcaverHIS019_0203120 [Cutaneotrichosporon cavernicola]|uniref:Ribosomal protein S9 n=1 Tax=Cutaneotrichosporon cavernicola TaxID=279322 RepID=A0AA48I8C4_9TREE|nr:uncharacterized protein CcaverHIS019_0203120 [Cutaneotrichosporon cavernicola]BEI88950.1 hypothetical protein CcaverHIS019_0203120 [Cutaneotrichosporon cavernicola]